LYFCCHVYVSQTVDGACAKLETLDHSDLNRGTS
jgi:hypothetical protein